MHTTKVAEIPDLYPIKHRIPVLLHEDPNVKPLPTH